MFLKFKFLLFNKIRLLLLFLLLNLFFPKFTYSYSNWIKHSASPLISKGSINSWDEQGVRAGNVIVINGDYKMWYSGANSNGIVQIGLATSNDGIIWNKYTNIWALFTC